jgi:hypothetical protein
MRLTIFEKFALPSSNDARIRGLNISVSRCRQKQTPRN